MVREGGVVREGGGEGGGGTNTRPDAGDDGNRCWSWHFVVEIGGRGWRSDRKGMGSECGRWEVDGGRWEVGGGIVDSGWCVDGACRWFRRCAVYNYREDWMVQ